MNAEDKARSGEISLVLVAQLTQGDCNCHDLRITFFRLPSMASGRIVFVSRNGAMLVVRHDDGYVLVEMIGDEGAISVGDNVFGDWDALGGERIRCGPHTYDAYFQGNWGSPETPMRMARSTGG